MVVAVAAVDCCKQVKASKVDNVSKVNAIASEEKEATPTKTSLKRRLMELPTDAISLSSTNNTDTRTPKPQSAAPMKTPTVKKTLAASEKRSVPLSQKRPAALTTKKASRLANIENPEIDSRLRRDYDLDLLEQRVMVRHAKLRALGLI